VPQVVRAPTKGETGSSNPMLPKKKKKKNRKKIILIHGYHFYFSIFNNVFSFSKACVPVALIYNPSYLGGKDQEDRSLKSTWANSL
jgi:hypothetical protein